jgi:hypothetical protein
MLIGDRLVEFSSPSLMTLTPCTSPDAVRESQIAAVQLEVSSVRSAWRSFGVAPTPAQLIDSLSHACDLPKWNVERHLGALGEGATPEAPDARVRAKREGDAHHAAVVAFLAKHPDYATVVEISSGTGLTVKQVRSVVCWERHEFAKKAVCRRSNKRQFAYQIKEPA